MKKQTKTFLKNVGINFILLTMVNIIMLSFLVVKPNYIFGITVVIIYSIGSEILRLKYHKNSWFNYKKE